MVRRAGLALVLAVVVPCAVSAADKKDKDKDKEKKPPVFASDVSLVSLPVFVVNPDGQAMGGLHAEDFDLYDDGKRVQVVSFQYVDTTSPEEQQAIRHAPAARRRFLMLFDLSFTEPAGINRARVAAADFVRRRMADSDLAAVATFDVNRGVRLLANFTEDRALLVHAIDTLGVPTLARINDPLGLAANVAATDIQISRSQGLGDANTTQADSVFAVIARRLRAVEEEQYRRQVLNLIGSLEELGKSLRNIEGRKQVLYFSAGFDSRALLGDTGSEMRKTSEDIVFGRIWEVDSQSRYGDTSLRTQFGDMTRLLSRADCVVHAVDVTGLGSDIDMQQQIGDNDSLHDQIGRDSLHYIAAETGGRLFKDSNDLAPALNEISDMTSRYYILGYQPEDLAGPGSFHKLKVKVQRKNARVSHRVGYFERLPRQAQSNLQRKFEAAQLVMTGVGTSDLAFSALCLPFPVKGESQALGLVLQVPRSELHWKSGQTLALEVYGYAVAADGTVQDHLAQLAQVDPGRADPNSTAQGLSFYGTLNVPPGQYTLKLLVQEPETGSAGVQFLDITVPPYDARAGFLLPPVVMDDPAHWLGLAMGREKAGDVGFPFELGGEPFLPRASFLVESGKAETLVLMAYDPSGPKDMATAGIEIRSVLTDATGVAVRPGLLKIDRILRGDGGRRTYVLAYTPGELSPGDYTLRIGVGEANTHLESYSLVRVAPTVVAQ